MNVENVMLVEIVLIHCLGDNMEVKCEICDRLFDNSFETIDIHGKMCNECCKKKERIRRTINII